MTNVARRIKHPEEKGTKLGHRPTRAGTVGWLWISCSNLDGDRIELGRAWRIELCTDYREGRSPVSRPGTADEPLTHVVEHAAGY